MSKASRSSLACTSRTERVEVRQGGEGRRGEGERAEERGQRLMRTGSGERAHTQRDGERERERCTHARTRAHTHARTHLVEQSPKLERRHSPLDLRVVCSVARRRRSNERREDACLGRVEHAAHVPGGLEQQDLTLRHLTRDLIRIDGLDPSRGASLNAHGAEDSVGIL